MRRKKLLSVMNIAIILLANSSFAQVSENAQSVGTTAALVQVLGGLILVLAAIFGAAWLAKKLRLAGTPHANGIRVLSHLPLSRKEKLVLIETCGKKMLLGVASGSVNVLQTFDISETEDTTVLSNLHLSPKNEASEALAEKPRDFSSFLQAMLSNKASQNESH